MESIFKKLLVIFKYLLFYIVYYPIDILKAYDSQANQTGKKEQEKKEQCCFSDPLMTIVL